MTSIREIIMGRFQTRRGFAWAYAGELSDSEFEMSKSNRSACKLCGEKIPKDIIRAKVTELNTRLMIVGTRYYHLQCFTFLVLAEQQVLQNKYNEARAIMGAPEYSVPNEIVTAFQELLE